MVKSLHKVTATIPAPRKINLDISRVISKWVMQDAKVLTGDEEVWLNLMSPPCMRIEHAIVQTVLVVVGACCCTFPVPLNAGLEWLT